MRDQRITIREQKYLHSFWGGFPPTTSTGNKIPVDRDYKAELENLIADTNRRFRRR